MAKVEYVMCDRCKQKIKIQPYFIIDIYPNSSDKSWVVSSQHYDMCVDCRNKFLDFMEGKQV